MNYAKSEEEARAIQLQWKNKYLTNIKSNNSIKEIEITNEFPRYVAGVDVSYENDTNKTFATGCSVLWDLVNKKIVEIQFSEGFIEFPYISGLLTFREGPLILRSLLKLQKVPDIIFFDGNGKFHPLEFGEALHLGFALRIPSIGVAKTPIMINYNWKNLERKKGNYEEIRISSKTVAYAVVLAEGMKPVFISEGFQINLNQCMQICLKLSANYRQPIPLALAHINSKNYLQKLKNE
ncbi:MAG: endonuclease V [Promethearchaeota archaeon]